MLQPLERAWMEVDLSAVVRNTTTLQSHAGVPVIPMVKADAYGIGARQVAHALESVEPLAYGVATIVEGQELREAGISRPILVFTPLLQEELRSANDARLTPTLGSAAAISAWSRFGGLYHLSIDTGMARAGLPWREIESVIEQVIAHPPQGAFTHFHSPSLNDGTMDIQEERFRAAIGALPVRPHILHTDSSGAIVRHGRSAWDAIRPGIFMYGVGSGDGAQLEPDPVVHVRARITEIRDVEPGDSVSYDATWTADSRRQIATIPLGYADGYPRALSSIGKGLIRGGTVGIAGRVTMDMIMLDVTGTGAETGDVVTMVGSTEDQRLDVELVAGMAGMSPYELLTGLRSRLRRIYRGQ
ncbi:MAG TPA: alanine racemase [Gemmatimonadaceae bacterium]|nr:alanine racemase [Gemmatimonadaceae bacterium]